MLDNDSSNCSGISRDSLVEDLESGCKPISAWRIGTEHEKFGFHKSDLTPLTYHGDAGIQSLLNGLAQSKDWEAIQERGNTIALKQLGTEIGSSITLEPGGQFELSGAPLKTIHETCDEVHDHLQQVRGVAEPLDIGFVGLGFSPKWTLDETPRMPKGRYEIMSRYMTKVGNHGLDMMFRSCTVQVNLDFSSEEDMVKKFRVSMALQPVATAIFANSPFTEGRPNGFLSYRSELWRDTDPDRTGMLPFIFEDGMSFERYVDYALDIPMYFIVRDKTYIDATQSTFRSFMEGRHPSLEGYSPTQADWADHLTTIFPEVRLKHFLEMRGADAGPWQSLCALPALWVGILYSTTSLNAAYDLIKTWSSEDRQSLRDQVPRSGFDARIPSGTVQDIAREMVEIAEIGLKERNCRDARGNDERHFLTEVEDIVYSGRTRAQMMLEKYKTDWGGSVDPVFENQAY